MEFNSIKDLIDFRITESEDDYSLEDYWDTAVAMLSANIQATITFIDADCDDEEFFWLTENLEDLIQKTQSRDLINVCKKRLSRVTRDNYHQQDFRSEHMRKWVNYDEYVRSTGADIDYAEEQLLDMVP